MSFDDRTKRLESYSFVLFVGGLSVHSGDLVWLKAYMPTLFKLLDFDQSGASELACTLG